MKAWELVKTCGKQLDKDEIVYEFAKIKQIKTACNKFYQCTIEFWFWVYFSFTEYSCKLSVALIPLQRWQLANYS